MNVQQSFEVAAPASEVYAALLDLERVAPCLPGAEGVEKVGDTTYNGSIRVRVGPITMRYKADIEIVEQDPAAYRAKMRVQARETKGQGTADADATLTLTEDGGVTRGAVDVEVKLSGRAASMGASAIQDVSSRLVGQFAANLGAMLSAAPPADASGTAPADGPAPDAAGATPAAAPAFEPASEPLDGLGLAGTVALGQLRRQRVPLLVLATGILLGILIGRRRR